MSGWGYGHIEYTAVVTRGSIDGTETIDAYHCRDHLPSRSAEMRVAWLHKPKRASQKTRGTILFIMIH